MKLPLSSRLAVCIALALSMCVSARGALLPTGATILSSSAKGFALTYKPKLTAFDTTYLQDGTLTVFPKIDGAFPLRPQHGVQQTAGVSFLLTVPSANGWKPKETTVLIEKSYAIGMITPAVVVPMTLSETGRDQAITFTKAEVKPPVVTEWAVYHYEGLSGNRHIVRVTLSAWKRDAQTGKLIIPTSISVGVDFITPTQQQPASRTDDNGIELTLNHNQTRSFVTTLPQALAKTTPVVLNSDISNGTWVRIPVTASGVYKVDAAMLQRAGVSIPRDQVATVKVFNHGGMELPENVSAAAANELREQAVILQSDGGGNFESVTFYGAPLNGFRYSTERKVIEHWLHHYGSTNYYYLTFGGRAGKRASPVAPPAEVVTQTPSSYTIRTFNEEELVNPYGAGSGRRWFGKQIDNLMPKVFTTQLPNLLRSGTVTYRIAVAHKNDTDGSFTIQENGSPLVTVQVAGKRDESYVEYVARQTMLSVPASTIAADNRSVLRMSYVNPSNPTSAFGYIDFFEIHYPSQLVPHNNSVDFVSDTGVTGVVRYDFNGFSGNPIGFDVTDPANPILLTNQATTGGMFNFTAKIDSASPRSFYISASITSPDIERVGEWANLRDDIANAHVIVVTAPELLASAMNYAKYREANSSMKVKVVSTTALYHEFSSGVPDITAIRDYIAYAYRNWTSVKPAYVILWGDGHFDYKSISAINRNFIPTYQTDDIDPSFNRDYYWRYTDNYSTEDYFVCVNGNDRLVDVTLGRVPINSPEEGDWALEKIRIYEKESSQDAWRTFVTMIADDGPTSYGTDYNSHTQQSENIANDDIEMPEDIQVRKIYMAEYPTENIPKGRRKPRVTEDMLTAVNARGSVILNWIGHGNPRVWAHEVIYDRDETTQQFTNLTKQFFLVAATCDFARFDLAEGQSGAEALVMSRRGGAIGCFSSTRVVFSGENAALAQDFYRELFRRGSNGLYKRIGDVIAVTKQTNTSVNDQKYFLLGDPTVRIHVPNSVVKFSSINGISVDSSTDINVKALSEVTIRGTIGDFPGTSVDKSYNGIVQLTMFDTDVNMRVQDPAAMASSARDSSVHAFSRLGAALHRGTYQVVNGEFTATFIVPKDISFLNKPGRLFGYSRTNDSTRYAKGMTDKFSVGGISDIGFSDDNGPVMNIFMDERTFKAGDLVRSNPLLIVDLADESGINATGIGVGHKIEAWLDDNTESIDLTEDFTTSLKDAKSGSAIKQLFALSPGQHTVRVRAWDILNNFTQGSTYFRVGENDKSVFSGRVEVYPNPFSEKINVFFTHNQGFSFDAELRIFTVQGKQVRYIQQSTTTLQSGNFLWDGTDEDGATLPQGTYPFTLRLIAADGNAQVYRGIMIYLQ